MNPAWSFNVHFAVDIKTATPHLGPHPLWTISVGTELLPVSRQKGNDGVGLQGLHYSTLTCGDKQKEKKDTFKK